MSRLELTQKDVFQSICEHLGLPDVFVLRRCSKTLKAKSEIFLSDVFALSTKFSQIVCGLLVKLNPTLGLTCTSSEVKYVSCCKKVCANDKVFQCLFCGYTFCRNLKDCGNYPMARLQSIAKQFNAKKPKTHSICKNCVTDRIECQTCKKILNGSWKWCHCYQCRRFYCNTAECLGLHNEVFLTFPTSHPGYDEDPSVKAFYNNFTLECSDCRSECVRCGHPSSGARCKFCDNALCTQCRIESNPRMYIPDSDRTYFCLVCAQKKL